MKKNNIALGAVYIVLGMLSLYFAVTHVKDEMSGLFYGFAGALGGNGIFMILRYFYWTNPKNEGKYQKMAEIEEIERQDELKQKIRDKAGKYTHWIGLVIISVSIFIYSVLGALEVMDTKNILMYLSVYLIFQIVVGIIVFNHLLKKYH